MKDLDQVSYFPVVEELSKILCNSTQNTDPKFFRILTTYYLAKVASMMRCNIETLSGDLIPVNMYAINLATSGWGKGKSTNLIEDKVLHLFKKRFLDSTFGQVAEKNVLKLANARALKKGTTGEEELEGARIEFNLTGPLLFSFDSGTSPAIKQLRHKLLMSGAGSLNLEIDEIGSNLVGQTEILNPFLELYDLGKLKPKLIKNTKENIRNEDIDGKTPTNMMLFGTPTKLLDGSKTEEDFYSMLDTGYARRCIFSFSKLVREGTGQSVQEVFDSLYATSAIPTEAFLTSLAQALLKLADPINFNINLKMGEAVTKLDIEYRLSCEARAAKLPSYEETKRTELSHRFFKTLKAAGAYAFCDGAVEVTEDHYYHAMKLVESSGEDFAHILTRDRNYVRLAKYISEVNTEVTHADIQEDLNFYKGSEAHRRDLMNLAIAWGYKNNVVIKKSYDGDIEFMSGVSLPETDLSQLIFSYSQDVATGYMGEFINWDDLYQLTQTDGYHFINHHLSVPRRKDINCKGGFNTVILDVDGTCSIASANMLLTGLKYLPYTTKRSTPHKERFRIIFPISHRLSMGTTEFKTFMDNIYSWMPFDSDSQTGQRARKWLTCDAHYEYHDGELLDALMFIPETKKSEERKKIIQSQQDMDNIERWFCNTTDAGSRNNQMLKYGMLMADSGMSVKNIQDKLLSFNSKLEPKLEEIEILSTVMRTVSKKVHQVQQQQDDDDQ